MSVMTPEQIRNTRLPGRPIQQVPETPTTAAVLQQLAPSAPAAPAPAAAPVSSTFQRGGQVSQRPGIGPAVANAAAGLGADAAGQIAARSLASGGGAPAWASGAAGAGLGVGINMAGTAIAEKHRVKEEMPTLGENDEWADLVGGYGRRYEGTGGGLRHGAELGATYGSNPALLAATGGISAGVGALAGLAAAAATKNAPSAFTDFRVEDAVDALTKQYQRVLGRTPSEDEILGQLVGIGWDPKGGDRWVGEKDLYYLLGTVRDSDEAKRRAAGGGQAADAGVAGIPGAPGLERGTPTMRDVAALMAGESPTGAPSTGVLGADAVGPKIDNGPVERQAAAWGDPRLSGGWDKDKFNGGHDSPKYLMGRGLLNTPGFDPTKGLRDEDIAALNALGLGQFAREGDSRDKVRVTNGDPRFNGVSVIDLIQGLGTGNGKLNFEDALAGGGGGDAALMAALTGQGGAGGAQGPTDASSLPGVVQAIQALLSRQGAGSQGGYTDALLRELNATA